MTTENQEFSPGEKVLLRHEGPGIYPDASCTVIEKMVDKLEPCHVCGNLWHGYGGPDYWKNNPSYLLQFETGAKGIFPVRRIKKVEGSAPCVAEAEGASDGAKARQTALVNDGYANLLAVLEEVQNALLDGGELAGPLASLKLANNKMRQIIAKLETA